MASAEQYPPHSYGETRDERFLVPEYPTKAGDPQADETAPGERRRRMHEQPRDQRAWLSSVLRGLCLLRTPGNSTALGPFHEVMKVWRQAQEVALLKRCPALSRPVCRGKLPLLDQPRLSS